MIAWDPGVDDQREREMRSATRRLIVFLLAGLIVALLLLVGADRLAASPVF